MRRASVFVSAILLAIFSFSQDINSNLFFQTNGDTITFFLDATGELTSFDKAVYYRNAVFEKDGLFYSGAVNDYFMNGQKAYESNYTRSGLNGEVKAFYPDGKIRYTGFFKESKRDSVWVFYYENGNKEKVIEIRDGEPYFKEYYQRNGKLVFDNGNGRYRGRIFHKANQVNEYEIRGRIVEGKMHGTWNWSSAGARGNLRYNHGKALTGNNSGRGWPIPEIPKVFGFELHEEIDVFQFFSVLLDNFESRIGIYGIGVPLVLSNPHITTYIKYDVNDHLNQPLKYRNSHEFNRELVFDLSETIAGVSSKNKVEHFWGFIQFIVSEKNTVESLDVFSNNEFVKAGISKFLSENNLFEAPRINGKIVPVAVYLSVLMESKHLYFPKYYYFGNLIFDN